MFLVFFDVGKFQGVSSPTVLTAVESLQTHGRNRFGHGGNCIARFTLQKESYKKKNF